MTTSRTVAADTIRGALPPRPRILVIGAGVLGTVYATKLALAGHDVSVAELSRQRREELTEHGLVIEALAGGRRESVRVPVLEKIEPDAEFDVAVAIVRKTHIDSILESLAPTRIRTLLFMVSNADGPQVFIDMVGARAVGGFPGAGGAKHGPVVRYSIPPAFMQRTMLSEVDGVPTNRVRSLARIFKSAGFVPLVISDLDSWLKSHEGFVAATANATYVARGDGKALGRDASLLRLNVQAIREVYATMDALGIPVAPKWFRVWQRLPIPVIVAAFRRFVGSPAWELGTDQMNGMRDEVEVITEELLRLADTANIPTPALDELVRRRESMKFTTKENAR
ncbi:ketopantoate reductase family protein [Microbacterium sp. 2MCAF23]|uniref:ketopantoate reductase family protein n=1 Tax=Microbacterium sp. 2MCAF23 TaxID=3232985 RepID=UPI003F99DC38